MAPGKEAAWADTSLQDETIFVQFPLVIKEVRAGERAYDISADGLVIERFLEHFCEASVTLRKCASSNEEQKRGRERSLPTACCWLALTFLAQWVVSEMREGTLEKQPLLIAPWTLRSWDLVLGPTAPHSSDPPHSSPGLWLGQDPLDSEGMPAALCPCDN